MGKVLYPFSLDMIQPSLQPINYGSVDDFNLTISPQMGNWGEGMLNL